MDFKIKSDFKPTGDQPEAIKSIVTAINNDEKFSWKRMNLFQKRLDFHFL